MKLSIEKENRMKSLIYSSLFILFALFSTGFSQQNFKESKVICENEKSNYINGITSDNPGLKASCIYFVGRYRLADAGDMLVEELKKSGQEDLSLLIAWSIYRIGDENCIEELKRIGENHNSKRLKIFCAHLNQQKKFELAIEKSKQL